MAQGQDRAPALSRGVASSHEPSTKSNWLISFKRFAQSAGPVSKTCLCGNCLKVWGPAGSLFEAFLSFLWVHFLKTDLGTNGALRGAQGPNEWNKTTYLDTLSGSVSWFRAFLLERKPSRICTCVDVMLSCLRRSTAGAHLQSVHACAVQTHLSISWFSEDSSWTSHSSENSS